MELANRNEVNRLPVVAITWVDSYTGAGWLNPAMFADELKNDHAINSVGFLAYQDEQMKILVLSVGQLGNINGYIKIPASCIIHEQVLIAAPEQVSADVDDIPF